MPQLLTRKMAIVLWRGGIPSLKYSTTCHRKLDRCGLNSIFSRKSAATISPLKVILYGCCCNQIRLPHIGISPKKTFRTWIICPAASCCNSCTQHIGLVSRIIRGLDSVLLYVAKVRGSSVWIGTESHSKCLNMGCNDPPDWRAHLCQNLQWTSNVIESVMAVFWSLILVFSARQVMFRPWSLALAKNDKRDTDISISPSFTTWKVKSGKFVSTL